jgi:lipopolysaccharide export system protein LptA
MVWNAEVYETRQRQIHIEADTWQAAKQKAEAVYQGIYLGNNEITKRTVLMHGLNLELTQKCQT